MPPLQQSIFKHISKNLDVDGVTKELDKKNKILSTRLSKKMIWTILEALKEWAAHPNEFPYGSHKDRLYQKKNSWKSTFFI